MTRLLLLAVNVAVSGRPRSPGSTCQVASDRNRVFKSRLLKKSDAGAVHVRNSFVRRGL